MKEYYVNFNNQNLAIAVEADSPYNAFLAAVNEYHFFRMQKGLERPRPIVQGLPFMNTGIVTVFLDGRMVGMLTPNH